MRTRSGLPGASRASWPTTSSRLRGRSLAASGARPLSRSSTAALKRSSGNRLRRLRGKVGPEVIETVRGAGYKMVRP